MMTSVGLFLKLTSFHHVMHDTRFLLKRVKELKERPEDLPSHFSINEITFNQCMEYPKILSLRHYIRFLCAPTCNYQHSYPTNNKISVKRLVKYAVEFLICNLFMAYLIW